MFYLGQFFQTSEYISNGKEPRAKYISIIDGDEVAAVQIIKTADSMGTSAHDNKSKFSEHHRFIDVLLRYCCWCCWAVALLVTWIAWSIKCHTYQFQMTSQMKIPEEKKHDDYLWAISNQDLLGSCYKFQRWTIFELK